MLVTIGLPFANDRRTLPLAVRSVLAQTHAEWELILLEDGSSDSSAELLAQIRDPRVRLVRDSVNRGLAARLNQVATLARGKYLARMDADDAMHPDRIRRQIALLEAQPDTDFLCTAAYVIDNENRVRGLKSMEVAPQYRAAALDHSCWIHPTLFARKEWFLANPYDERMTRAEDYDLWARVYGHSRFAKIREPLFFYREGGLFNLHKYLTTKRSDQVIIRRYAPAIVGRARTEVLILKSHLKAAIYRVMSAVHAEDFLVNRRATPIDDAFRMEGEEILRRLEATPVPGWELV